MERTMGNDTMCATRNLLSYLMTLSTCIFISGCSAQPLTETVAADSEVQSLPTKSVMTMTPSLESTSIIPSLTPTQLLQCVSQLIPVTSEDQDVYRFWWSDDGETLYVEMRKQPETQAFNVSEGSFQPMPNLSYPGDFSLPEKIPDEIRQSDLSLSPYSDKVIYGLKVRPDSTPGLTPTPNAEGLTDPPDFASDIYLAKLDGTDPIYLGAIDGLLEGFTWFPDETKVLIQTSFKASGQAYEWLADLSDYSLSPLFPAGAESPTRSKAISPDGQWVLYSKSRGDNLRMKSVVDGAERELALTSPTRVWWLSTGDQLLLLYRDEENHDNLRLFWYNLQTEKLVPASNYGIDFDASDPVLLSPDETKVAFTWERSRQVFAITMCPKPH